MTRVEVVFKVVWALGHRILPNLLLTTLCKSFLGWLIAALNIVAALLVPVVSAAITNNIATTISPPPTGVSCVA